MEACLSEEPAVGDGVACRKGERGDDAPGDEAQQEANGEGDAHLTTVLHALVLFLFDQFVNGKVAAEVGELGADLVLGIFEGDSGNFGVRRNLHAFVLMAFDEGYLIIEGLDESPDVARLLGFHSGCRQTLRIARALEHSWLHTLLIYCKVSVRS